MVVFEKKSDHGYRVATPQGKRGQGCQGAEKTGKLDVHFSIQGIYQNH